MLINQTQRATETIGLTQAETQGLTIVNSHDVTVTQTEAQGLLIIQAALQAAIQASAVVLGTQATTTVT